MNLATRCPACGTVFRVAQDQLRASEGWVRCGRCDEVFSALKALFDLDRGAPPPLADPPRARAATPAEPEHDATRAATVITPLQPTVSMPLVRRSDEGHGDAAPPASAQSAPPMLFDGRLRPEPSGEPAQIRQRVDAPDAPTLINVHSRGADPAAPADDPWQLPAEDDLAGDSDTPAFVVHADRRRRWLRSTTRPVLMAAAAGLAVLLALQASHEFRATLVARWPALQPAAERICAVAGCTIGGPLRLAQLTVDSAALGRDEAAGVSRLAMTIRNRGATPVAVPAVELSLTDERGQVIVRRVFLPDEYGARDSTLAPHGDLPLALPLRIAEARAAGFSVEIFYP